MNQFKKAIQEKAKDIKIDLIGFAAKERFVDLDPQQDPFAIFPEGKTVILVGRMIPRGTLRGVEDGTGVNPYSNFGYSWLDNQFVAQSTYDMVRFIEDNGWEACPIFPNPLSTTAMGVSVAEGRPAPNVTPDFDYAAVACGLGELGLNQEFLTPELGHRQRFQMIITDAEIDSDPLLGEPICDKCEVCIAACPLGAISQDKRIEKTICGKTFLVAEINFELCKKCPNGGMTNRLHPTGKPDRYAAICNRTCLVELEKRGIGMMKNPFRSKDPWQKNRRGDLI